MDTNDPVQKGTDMSNYNLNQTMYPDVSSNTLHEKNYNIAHTMFTTDIAQELTMLTFLADKSSITNLLSLWVHY